jgi:M-phase inducer tyrosine phosphatase
MDVDDYIPTPVQLPSNPSAPTLGNLFYDDMSPRRSREHTPTDRVHRKKRRSLSPEGSPAVVRVNHRHIGTMRAVANLISEDDAALDSSPGQVSSPSMHRLIRKASGPLLGSNLSPSPFAHDVADSPSESISAVLMQKRSRRPALTSMQKTSLGLGRPVTGSLSANDAIDNYKNDDASIELRAPASRRAFSAMLPPSHKGLTGFAAAQAAATVDASVSEDDTSFDGPDMSSPAQAYTKRQSMKTLRRCDGTDNFRPLTGAAVAREAVPTMQQMKLQVSPSGRLLPGFGDNESLGKVLPCYRVREDGLMRIKPRTVRFYISDAANQANSFFCFVIAQRPP